MCSRARRQETAHAVACDQNVGGIDPEFGGNGRIAQEGDRSVSILSRVRESEGARTAPGSAKVKSEHVESRPTHGLGEI